MCSDLDCIRVIVHRCMKMHQYRSAVFWADKMVHLSNGSVNDTLLLAEVLFNSGQYHRTIALLSNNDTVREGVYARFLIAQCYFKCNEFLQALSILDNLDIFQHASSKLTSSSFIAFQPRDGKLDRPQDCDQFSVSDSEYLPEGITISNLNSSIALLKGFVNEALNNIPLAVYWYKEAFRLDSFCYEAFEKLVKLEAFSSDDEKLLSKCDFPGLSPAFVPATRSLLLNKIPKSVFVELPPEMEPLKNSVDTLIAQAERFLSINHYRRCYEITSLILKHDPLNPECLPIHVSVLRMLNKSNDLFMLANQLVRIFPNCAVSTVILIYYRKDILVCYGFLLPIN
uniref:TPR_REGION domain-containing protein n=1 Tax=Mesocestoides corti TaxID=53468 RepID=A0A5K3F086_MESCO